MKTKVFRMMAPGSLLIFIGAVLVYSVGLGNSAPTELTELSKKDDGAAYTRATTVSSPPSNDAKLWPPQKPSRSSKHIIKSNLYKKPNKDKGGRAKEKPFYSSTLVSTGYDVEKDNITRHKEPPTMGTVVVDNFNGPKNYTNKIATDTTTMQHSILHRTDTNVDDDVVDGSGGTGKDIDFISVAGTTESDETTYATAITTEGYRSKTEVASTTATMQTGLMENPNFYAEPNAKMSTTMKSVQDIKSISSPTQGQLTPATGKSLPVNASVSSTRSLSLSTTVQPKLDVGHDGVKITKKKQLFDKHFIAAPPQGSAPLLPSSGSLHLPPITRDNPWPTLSKNKPTKSARKKLMEVSNGYLGPIMMKEKTFSVTHHGKKPKPSIAEQLRDKKLVEIIAPTALMEPTIKVKSSVPPPEFIAIDSTASASVVISTTEIPSAPTPVPTVATSMKEEIESETATTYFLVVTHDSKTSAKETSGKSSETQPMNSGEIETTLKEIYTEVLNAMEESSKKKSTSTVVPKANGKTEKQDENSSIVENKDLSLKFDSDLTRKSNKDHPITDRVQFSDTDHLPVTVSYDLRLPSTDSGRTTDPGSDQHRFATTDRVLPSVTDNFTPSVTNPEQSSATDRATASKFLRATPSVLILPSIAGHTSTPTTVLSAKKSTLFPMTYQRSTTPIPPYSTGSGKLSTISIDASTITDHDLSFTSHRNLPPPTGATLTMTNRGSTFSSRIYHNLSDGTRSNGDIQTITDRSSIFLPMIHHGTFLPKNDRKLSSMSDDVPMTTDRSSPSSSVIHYDLSNKHASTSMPVKDHTLPTITKDARKVIDRWSTVLPMIQLYPSAKQNAPSIPMTVTTKDASIITDHYLSPLPVHSLSSITDGSKTITDRSSTSSLMMHHDISDKANTSTLPMKDNSFMAHNFSPSTDSTTMITDRSSTTSPEVYHYSSPGPSSTSYPNTDTRSSTHSPMADPSPTFATITTDSYTSSPSMQQQSLKPTHNSEQTESKISDIQIEVYDSTVEPILASTNFRGNSISGRHTTSKHAPSNSRSQERFTQYVVDKVTDFAPQESNSIAKASGKPEPAAIEIHINVSEGFGNESEDLEFSYRQSDYRKVTSKKPANTNFITLKPFDTVSQNETSNEAAEEIVVEIIDSNSNNTENSASRENQNVNPIFTFRTDDDSQIELKNVKYYPEDRPKEAKKSTDDFFVPHVGQQASGANKPMTDRDSDTIFYISNTEVKVGESLPTTNTYDAQLKKSRLESQFFPANYEERKKAAPQRYEEDIILSPLKNRLADPLKLVRGPLDISYVGESVMEVEQVTVTTTILPPITGSTPDVIIQPAVLPEMAIGVPVIGELPPQIELKEIDFMPNFDGNKEESSIQYGGDLIDEGGAIGAGFDMDSYPLGNLGMGAISSQTVLNHRVNHLKKDELSADLAASSETTDGNDLLRRSNDSLNGTVIGEKMGNATAYSVMEEPPAGDGELHFTDLQTLFTACLATLLPLVLSVAMAFGLRHLYRKYQNNPFNIMGHNSSTDPLDAEKGTGEDGDAAVGVVTPEELRASSLAFGATTDSPSSEIITSSNAANGKASDGDGRDCTGSVAANGKTAGSGSDMDVDCIQTIISESDFHEENAVFIGNCNIEAQPTTTTASTPQAVAIQPQSPSKTTTTTTASNAAATPATGTMQSNYSGANGSITTMTLKNNHLIVETEERNDISRDARETKMHYNNSEKDGVFVVEVSRGADSKIMPGSPVANPDDKRLFNIDGAGKILEEDKLLSSHEEVQIHPPPQENLNQQDEIESNHLHQIDEVDEFEEGPKITKHSNTGLSQSDLSSSSSVDSNKRYSYGNQELYTIEQQDYTTPSPAATKAPHPHADPQAPQPENHNDDNGHSENGHVLENGPPSAPNCDSMYPTDTDSDISGHNGIESKPKITAALLKQDTVIVNEFTNGLSHGDDHEINSQDSMENLSNGMAHIGYGDTENGFDSIISLPDPPSTEEMKQMNDIILIETNQLDSLPPPPPPGGENHHQHHNGNGIVPKKQTENGDSNSIASTDASPMNTPMKVMSPPTIMVASAPPTDIPHTNGNCMTGHTPASTAAVVVEVSGSS